jgi:transcriptional regulator with XRE-family HTH domain
MKAFNLEKFRKDLIGIRQDSTQAKIAQKLGINRSSLSLLETGKQIPSLEILTKVCKLGNFHADEYFDDFENDGLVYLMGTLQDNTDREKIKEMMDNIKIKEKYAILSRRCSE